MAGQEVATEVAISYLEQCGWELNKAIIKFKEEHGLKSKTICLSHSPRHSHIGKLEDERLQTQASLGYRDEYCLNDEGQGSTSSLVKAETRFTYKNALDEMIPLPVPQIAKMQQSQEDDLHSFVAHGVSREEGNAILDKWDWNVDQANNYVMDKRHPNKTSDDEKTPTASLPLMGLPVATPQMTVSAQDKEKMKHCVDKERSNSLI